MKKTIEKNEATFLGETTKTISICYISEKKMMEVIKN